MRSTSDRRNTDATRESMLFYGGDIAKHGYLLKSPPQSRISNQSSWKKRYFVLVKTSWNVYELQYYKSPAIRNQLKGSIAMEKVTAVRCGIGNQNTLAAVQKMFKCPPEQVVTIMTEKREYFLIGEETAQVQEWFNAIHLAWREMNPVVEQQPEREEGRLRSISVPVSLHSSDPIFSNTNVSDTMAKAHGCSSRPHSDPCAYCIDAKQISACALLPFPEYHGHSVPKEIAPDVNDSPDEGIYDYPNSRPAYTFDRVHEEPGDRPKSEDSDVSEDEEERVAENTYVKMSALPQIVGHVYANIDYTGTITHSQNPLVFYEEQDQKAQCGTSDCSPARSLGWEEKRKSDTSIPTSDPSFRQQGSIERRGAARRRSTPSQVKLSKLFISKEPKLFTEVDLSLPTEDASKYLTLLELGQRICVSKLSASEHMGCQFHYGDHILAVNGIEVKNKEEVFQLINKARGEEVKVTVLRVPGSDVLHAEICTCP